MLCRTSPVGVWGVQVHREEDLPFLALLVLGCENRSDYGSKRTAPDYFAKMNTSPKLIKGLASAAEGSGQTLAVHRAVHCCKALPPSDSPAMLGTLMTALFFVVRALGQLGSSLFHEEPLPYLVYQPLPWQIQCVSQSRRSSRDSERGRSSRHNSIYSISGEKGSGTPDASSQFFSDPSEKAAVTIQTHFRRYQQQKHEKK